MIVGNLAKPSEDRKSSLVKWYSSIGSRLVLPEQGSIVHAFARHDTGLERVLYVLHFKHQAAFFLQGQFDVIGELFSHR